MRTAAFLAKHAHETGSGKPIRPTLGIGTCRAAIPRPSTALILQTTNANSAQHSRQRAHARG